MTTINISLCYDICCETQVDLPSGKTWEDADDWFFKWNSLWINWKDGTQTEHELNDPDIATFDMKYPSGFRIEDEDEVLAGS